MGSKIPETAGVHGQVFIVDDDPLVRTSLEMTLKLAGYDARSFALASELLDQISPSEPGCILTDVRMPGMDGLELQEELGRRACVAAVIVMTGHADVPQVVRAMKSGALDFIEKPFKAHVLLEHVAAALAVSRERSVHETVRSALAKRMENLTARERDVMKLLVTGLANKQIAFELGISTRTVEVHRAKILEKMNVRNVTELVRATSSLA